MVSLNKVFLVGNLTKDPSLKYTPKGQAVCDFTLAINRKYVVNGNEKEEVCFVDIVVWAKQAESCGKYLTKGSAAMVEGRLRNDNWEDKEGNKRSKLRVNADRVQFLILKGNQSSSNEEKPSSGYNKDESSQNSNKGNMPLPDDDVEAEDDIPF